LSPRCYVTSRIGEFSRLTVGVLRPPAPPAVLVRPARVVPRDRLVVAVDQRGEHDLTARTPTPKDQYGIQSPFDGTIHYPAGHRSWAHPKRNIKRWLEEWGVAYVESNIGDGRPPALMVRGGSALDLIEDDDRPRTRPGAVPKTATKAATAVLKRGQWPFVWWGLSGTGGPRPKKYLEAIRKGFVPMTYWASEEYEEPLELDPTSWEWEQSGLSQTGIKELTAIVGKGHGFETVKPLQLITKIVQIWCPPDGLVLDPFAGSGTTGHAVWSLNAETGTSRRFVLIEQGRPERGDSFARTLAAERLKRVATGEWATGKHDPLPVGFTFMELKKRVDADALLRMERDEMAETVIYSYFDASRRSRPGLVRVDEDCRYLVARNEDEEGFFLVWDGPDKNTSLTREVYAQMADEAKRAGLKRSYHVYARQQLYVTANVRFYQIPDRILADFGLNPMSEPFSEVDE
jgi:adenine-specific DNA-methyltransferase